TSAASATHTRLLPRASDPGGPAHTEHRRYSALPPSSNDPQLAETPKIPGTQRLRMLDPPAKLMRVRTPGKRVFEDVEHLAVGAVSDRVHAKLEPVLQGEIGGAANVRRIFRVEPARIGCVRRKIRVRLQQPRAAGSERAIDLTLDGAH